MLVYKVTNTVNGKAYIGITARTVDLRWRFHLNKANNGSRFALHCAMRKYGADNFRVEAIYTATSLDELKACEKGLIAAHGTFAPHGYNMTAGGDGVWGLRHGPETRIIIRLRRAANPPVLTEDGRRRLGDLQRGDKNIMRRSRSAVLASAEKRRGGKRSPDTCRAISRNRKGKGLLNMASADLTAEQAAQIKALLLAGYRGKDVAAHFGVGPTAISKIRTGVHWRHVPPAATVLPFPVVNKKRLMPDQIRSIFLDPRSAYAIERALSLSHGIVGQIKRRQTYRVITEGLTPPHRTHRRT